MLETETKLNSEIIEISAEVKLDSIIIPSAEVKLDSEIIPQDKLVSENIPSIEIKLDSENQSPNDLKLDIINNVKQINDEPIKALVIDDAEKLEKGECNFLYINLINIQYKI